MASDQVLWAQMERSYPREKRKAWYAKERLREDQKEQVEIARAQRLGVAKVEGVDLWRDKTTGLVYMTREEAMDRAIARLLDPLIAK